MNATCSANGHRQTGTLSINCVGNDVKDDPQNDL